MVIHLLCLNDLNFILIEQLCQINLRISDTITYLLVRIIIVCEDSDMLAGVLPIHATLLNEEILEIREIHTIDRVSEENDISGIIEVPYMLFDI